jgi:hypothetical protein
MEAHHIPDNCGSCPAAGISWSCDSKVCRRRITSLLLQQFLEYPGFIPFLVTFGVKFWKQEAPTAI